MDTKPIAANISHGGGILQGLATGTSAWYASYVVTAMLLAFFAFSSKDKYPELPWLNQKAPTELTSSKRRAEFIAKPIEHLHKGSTQFKDTPYKLNTENGPVLVLPPKYVNELKSDRNLDFKSIASENTHAYLPGFEPLNSPPTLPQIINKHLTKALLSLTQPISLETTNALKDVFKESKEWTTITPSQIGLVVSRMSSRIFMGKELCNDKEWIETSSDYVFTLFRHQLEIAEWPRRLRPLANWLSPQGAVVRQKLQRCRDVLQPHLEKRQAVIDQALARGEKSPYNDAIEWFADTIGKNYDAASAQIGLSLVAIHTTADLLTQTMYDLAKNPELIPALRQEVIDVLSTNGLTKLSFQKLVLVDGSLKESQRLRPIFTTFFIRKALQDVVLSDGFVVKKGTSLAMNGTNVMMNEEIYPEPHKYNPYRYVKMRQTFGEENKAHLVSTSPEHFGFGHGIRACPGRFFAANELKIAMAHILLKYDWKLADGAEDLKPRAVGINYLHNPAIKLMVRRRKEELDLDSLEF
ncbi:uncharacterized protein PpBr36_11369 [Pyricularia pennisetigena]|uniref:uncharacterized protein n=1 Tax=Pyricularia pennisetigena TaxID=1578925 RepID=UPI00114DC945|nr:uncharacterized protein PpBr36_11369 [Pyricularia pennisetigena]TLS20367.1 hypothetical protein PpBr36_11369 [Pyricularia pennisetigena]